MTRKERAKQIAKRAHATKAHNSDIDSVEVCVLGVTGASAVFNELDKLWHEHDAAPALRELLEAQGPPLTNHPAVKKWLRALDNYDGPDGLDCELCK
ncbi:MAG: hypothetical protein GTN69_02450 [Armatimonadetes bacterium]|nr:hypothetical protein [Armatimonadota bacterium]